MRTGNPEPRPIFFFRPLANEDLFFYNNLKIIAVVNEGAKVLDICTKLMGLPDLASDVSPLFAEPMFLFGWALCNTSTYCKVTFWLNCANYALRGKFPFLHRPLQYIFTYALFWLPRVNFSLKNLPPYCTILWLNYDWVIKLLKRTKAKLINMFNVRKLRFSRFFNFALWAEKFTFTQKQKKTMRLLFDIFSENFIWSI